MADIGVSPNRLRKDLEKEFIAERNKYGSSYIQKYLDSHPEKYTEEETDWIKKHHQWTMEVLCKEACAYCT